MLLLMVAFLMAPVSHAATYVVPTDEQMVEMADAIIAGRVIGTQPQARANTIETLTTITITSVLKGPFRPGEKITITEPGGAVGSTALVIPGVPEFQPGEEVILFIEQKDSGEWTTLFFALGKFRAKNGIVIRDTEIHGWTTDGQPHAERDRRREPFVRFIVETLRGQNPTPDYFSANAAVTTESSEPVGVSLEATSYPPSAYVTSVTTSSGKVPVRWRSFGTGVPFRSRGTQAGAPNGGIDAISQAMSSWNGHTGSNIHYVYAGTTSATNGLDSFDEINSVVFNDPRNTISGSGPVGTLGLGGFWASLPGHTFKGETFYEITHGDVVLQDGLGSWPGLTDGRFVQLLAHELGHTLGFRHSDQGVPATTAAVMSSSIQQNFRGQLQAWDRDAAATVYGTVVTTPPPVTGTKGDANGDGLLTTADIFYLINHLFSGGPAPVGNADANGDGAVSTADIFFLINLLFT